MAGGWPYFFFQRADFVPKRILAPLLILLMIAGSFGRPAAAADGDTPYILVDLDSGAVIAERNSGDLWYPASLTKLMTAYVTFKALAQGRLTLSSPVTISANALREPPSKMGFPVGTVLTVDNALKMLIVKSANDIAVALGEAVGGSEAGFVDLMNQEAARLGLTATRFVNPNGLPAPGQHTSARDLAVLGRAIWREFPEFRPLFGIPAIRSGRKVLPSPNMLLERYQGANGMKTGFICSSGYNVVATATRNGRTMMAVVLGESSSLERAEAAAGLLNRGFSNWALLPQMRQTLDTFQRASTRSTTADLRETVCRRHQRGETDDGDAAATAASSSALGPRVALMDPVPVFTGGAVSTEPAVDIPLPRAKPLALVQEAHAATVGAEDLTVPPPPFVPFDPGIPFPRPKP